MLLDSFAWIEYLKGSERGRTVERILAGPDVSYTAPIVLAEVWSKLRRTVDEESAAEAMEVIQQHCALIVADDEIGVAAGQIHAEMKARAADFGMADAFVLASARARGVKVLTGDPHFKDVDDAVLL
jgi:predicted nucleic acid-binding protein